MQPGCAACDSWPFDGLCPTSKALSAAGFGNAALIGADERVVYRQCNANIARFLPPVKVTPWCQPDGAQYKLVAFYNGVSVFIVVFILVFWVGFDEKASVEKMLTIPSTTPGNSRRCPPLASTAARATCPRLRSRGMQHSVLCVAAGGDPAVHGGLKVDT